MADSAADHPHPLSAVPAELSAPAPTPAPTWRFAPGDLLAALLVISWAVFMLMRISYGLDLTDEGMYLSETDRLVRGDVPFRDDQESPIRPFNLLLSWVWGPAGGFSLIGARTVGVALQIAQMATLWLVVRRWWGAWVAAVAVLMVPRVPLLAIWTPGYNDLATTFIIVFAACLALSGDSDATSDARAGRRWAASWGVAAGAALALAGLSYLPTLALAVVPLAMVGWGRWRGSWRHSWMVAGLAALATVALVMAAAVAWLLLTGLGPVWLADARSTFRQQSLAMPVGERVMTFLRLLWPFAVHLAVTALMLAVVRFFAGRLARARQWWVQGGLIGGGLLAAMAYDFHAAPLLTPEQSATVHALYLQSMEPWKYQVLFTQMVVGAACCLVFVLPGGLKAMWRGRSGGHAALTLALIAIGSFGAITALSSTIAGYSGLGIRGAVEALGAAGVGAFLIRCNPAPFPAQRAAMFPSFMAGTSQAVLAVMVAAAGWTLVYRDDAPAGCTATFHHAPLAGVHSTPQRVRAIEALQDWIDAHAAPDARMLAYHDVPGLYFAARRRPVLAHTWTSVYWPWNHVDAADAVNGGLIAHMQQAGLQPDFCVRNLANDYFQPYPAGFRLNDPVHAYVSAHFQPAWRCWPYEVLVPRDPQVPPAASVTVIDAVASAGAPTAKDTGHFRVYSGPVDQRVDGALVLDVDQGAASPLLATLTMPGADVATLRLRVDGDGSGFLVLMVIGEKILTLPDPPDPNCQGWEITFPAVAGGQAIERGFAIVRSGLGRPSYAFRRLALEELPPVPGPP